MLATDLDLEYSNFNTQIEEGALSLVHFPYIKSLYSKRDIYIMLYR